MERSSITPEQLLRCFEEAPTSSVSPFQGPIPSRLYTHPPLYPGEQIILQQDHVTCVDSFDRLAEGILHLTTYRVLFTGVYDKNHLDTKDTNSNEVDAEELSRRGSQRQSFSRNSALVNGNNNIKNGINDMKKWQGRINVQAIVYSIPRTLKHVTRARNSHGLRYTQSLKKRSHTSLDIAGLEETHDPKLQKFRPIIYSNLEHIAHAYDLELSIACTSIYEIRKYPKKHLPRSKAIFMQADGFELLCSNIQSHRFWLGLQSSHDADSLTKLLMYHARPAFPRLFAFAHKNAIIIPTSCDILESTGAPNFYNFQDEFKRLGVLSLTKWRIPSHLCMQYPSQTLVPSNISDTELNTVAVFHKNWPDEFQKMMMWMTN